MLDKQLVLDVLNAALATGGDFAELFVENHRTTNLSMENGKLEKAVSGTDFGAGLRIFDGFGAVYAYTSDLSREGLLKLAKQAAAAINKPHIHTVSAFTPYEYSNINVIKRMPDTVKRAEIVDKLRAVTDAAYGFNPSVTQVTANHLDRIQDVLIANSDGLWVTDRRVYTRLYSSAIASSATEKQSGYYGPGAHVGFELYDGLDLAAVGRRIANTAVTMLNARPCPGGKMPAVIGNGFGGVIFHEACGHSLEATSVARGTSEFCGKLGQLVANPVVTAIDDGTIPNGWGSENVDDEGTPTQKNVLIENGVLKTYMIDRLNGLKMGAKSTGSSRRQNYRLAPTSRMTNTYIAPGTSTVQEIIGSVEYGLFAKHLGGGSVNPATGDFNFAVTEGYLIRNGQIAEPVRGATLIGKGSQVIKDIDMVSDNLTREQGMCGSVSGSIPADCGQPTLRVRDIIVGGRSE